MLEWFWIVDRRVSRTKTLADIVAYSDMLVGYKAYDHRSQWSGVLHIL